MAPDWARLPLVGNGDPVRDDHRQPKVGDLRARFSLTHQAVQLGFLATLRTEHPVEKAAVRSTSSRRSLGLAGMVIILGAGFPKNNPAGRLGLWHRH